MESMSFESVITDLSVFHEGASSTWSGDDIALIFELCEGE